MVLDSVDTTEAVTSAAIGIDLSVSGTPSLGGLVPSASGASKALAITVSGQGVYSFVQKAGQFTFDTRGQGTSSTLDIREIGNELYLSSPRLAALDGGKPWVQVDLSQYEEQESQDTGPVGALSTGDPSALLNVLRQVGTVSELGSVDIDGVPTTEYQAQIDLLSGTTGSTIISRQLAQALGLQNLPIDVWVDSAGRARQVATSFSVVGLTIKGQESLGSFGTPVSVTAPPAGQVADGSGLLQNGQLGDLFGF